MYARHSIATKPRVIPVIGQRKWWHQPQKQRPMPMCSCAHIHRPTKRLPTTFHCPCHPLAEARTCTNTFLYQQTSMDGRMKNGTTTTVITGHDSYNTHTIRLNDTPRTKPTCIPLPWLQNPPTNSVQQLQHQSRSSKDTTRLCSPPPGDVLYALMRGH